MGKAGWGFFSLLPGFVFWMGLGWALHVPVQAELLSARNASQSNFRRGD